MRSERGQASVEWIGLVLLLALALAALARFAPRADAGALGAELVHAITCVGARRLRGAARGAGAAPRRGLVTAPPLVPLAPARRRVRGSRAPRSRDRGFGRRAPACARSGGPGAAPACSGGARGYSASATSASATASCTRRFASPATTIPSPRMLRIANDCLSPVDLVRDWA